MTEAGLAWMLVLIFGPVFSAKVTGETMHIYVSTEGNDDWSGRLPAPNDGITDGPYRTLKRAAEVLDAGGICEIRAGTYRETLRPATSGLPGKPIVFRAYEDEEVILSGADLLTDWVEGDGRLYHAPMDWSLKDQNQLFTGNRMLDEARWPNAGKSLMHPKRAKAKAGTPTTLTDPAIPGTEADWKGAYLWCAGGAKWICWSARITGFDVAGKTLTFEGEKKGWYVPKAGSEYVLMGAKAALDAEGEWWLDREQKRLWFYPPAGQHPRDLGVEAKRRLHVMDLSSRSHVHIEGLRFRAGGIRTDNDSRHLEFRNLKGEYVAHSFVQDVTQNGIQLFGEGHTIHSCELAYSSGGIIALEGRGHRLINCYIHHGNYGAKWKGAVSLAGRRHVISHNTFQHSGRDLVTIHGLMESIFEHNDLSEAGWLTHDLGLMYGHNTDFHNTEIRYNRVHDNRAAGLAMGIYFDHLSHNAIVHHNAVWNVAGDPIRFNNPSYFNLVFNNTSYRTGRLTTFDHSRRNDLYGMRLANNVFNQKVKLTPQVKLENNLIHADPSFENPGKQRFGLKEGSPALNAGKVIPGISDGFTGAAPDIGAFERDRPEWEAGHDFEHPPQKVSEWTRPDISYMNLVTNACFEFGSLEGWRATGDGKAELVKGNGWGNGWGSEKSAKTGTSKFECRLSGTAGVEQAIRGLSPGTACRLSAWVKVSENETIELGIRDPAGKEESLKVDSREWDRLAIEFMIGPEQTEATIFCRKISKGDGHAWCDNFGLTE